MIPEDIVQAEPVTRVGEIPTATDESLAQLVLFGERQQVGLKFEALNELLIRTAKVAARLTSRCLSQNN